MITRRELMKDAILGISIISGFDWLYTIDKPERTSPQSVPDPDPTPRREKSLSKIDRLRLVADAVVFTASVAGMMHLHEKMASPETVSFTQNEPAPHQPPSSRRYLSI